MNTKVFGFVLVLLMITGIGLYMNAAPSNTDKVGVMAHGASLTRGLNTGEHTTRATDLRPDEVKTGNYIPDNWDVSLVQNFNGIYMQSYPVGSEEAPLGDTLITSVNDNLTLNFSSVVNLGGSDITNITVNWGDSSSNGIDVGVSADVLNYNFTHSYTHNGTYTLQAWLWHYQDYPTKTYAWTYGSWPVLICDGYITGYANWSDSGNNLLRADSTFPEKYAFNDSIVFQLPQGTTGIYDYDPQTGLPRENKAAYTDDELAGMVYLDLSAKNNMFRMIDTSFNADGQVRYFTFGFNAHTTIVDMWGADEIAIEPVDIIHDSRLTNLSGSPDSQMFGTMNCTNATAGIQNLTLTITNDFENAFAYSEFNYQDYSAQLRPIADLYISLNGGGTTDDGKITTAEANFALAHMNEDFVENWLGSPIPTTSANNFYVDGYAYNYVPDSIIGVSMSAQDYDASEPFQFTLRASYVGSQIEANKTSHTVTLLVKADSPEWNRTYLFTAPAGWDVLTVTPLGETHFRSWNWTDGDVAIDSGDGNDTVNIVVQKMSTSTTGNTSGAVGSTEEKATPWYSVEYYGQPLWVWLTLAVVLGGLGYMIFAPRNHKRRR